MSPKTRAKQQHILSVVDLHSVFYQLQTRVFCKLQSMFQVHPQVTQRNREQLGLMELYLFVLAFPKMLSNHPYDPSNL
jgi:hypothetical protein